MELFDKLGINPLLLFAQIINFFILLGLLWRFLYKPLMKALRQRRERIEQSLAEAEQISRDLAASEVKAQTIVQSATERAEQERVQAEQSLAQQRIDRLRLAESEAAQIFKRTETSIKEERQRAEQDVRRAAVELVAQATERVLQEGLTEQQQRKLIERAVEELS
ncbi:MAG: F0F1 ATP synthase subunit B [Candidatus Andersenbacteria bacterium]